MGIDRTVASYNVNAYINGKTDKIDVDLLGELSEDALPYIASLAGLDDNSASVSAKELLARRYSGDVFLNENGRIELDTPKGTEFSVCGYIGVKAVNKLGLEPQYYDFNLDLTEGMDGFDEFNASDYFEEDDELDDMFE